MKRNVCRSKSFWVAFSSRLDWLWLGREKTIKSVLSFQHNAIDTWWLRWGDFNHFCSWVSGNRVLMVPICSWHSIIWQCVYPHCLGVVIPLLNNGLGLSILLRFNCRRQAQLLRFLYGKYLIVSNISILVACQTENEDTHLDKPLDSN